MSKRLIIINSCFILLFLLILFSINSLWLYNIEFSVFKSLEWLRTDNIIAIFKFITDFGSTRLLILITILAIVMVRKPIHRILIGLNLPLVYGLNVLLKEIILRPRPDFRLFDQSGFSFPSGHAMVSFAVYGLFIYFIYKSKMDDVYKKISIGLISLLIFLIGFSRILFGVHYMSDVIAGFLIGFVYLSVYICYLIKKRG